MDEAENKPDFFDPEKELTKSDWNEINQQIDFLKSRPYEKYNFYRLISSAKILGSDRYPDIPTDWDVSALLTKYRKDSPMFLAFVSCLKTIDPSFEVKIDDRELEEMVNSVFLADTVLMVKRIAPAWNSLPQDEIDSMENYLAREDRPTGSHYWTVFAKNQLALRKLGIVMPKITAQEWVQMKTKLKELRELRSSQFAELAANMTELAKGKWKEAFTESLVPPQPPTRKF